MYVCEWDTSDTCWRNWCNFPWWIENVKSRSKIAPFSNERHLQIWFSKRKTITFFSSKLSKLHKEDPILHVTSIFSLKQGEARTSSGPIPHPLSTYFEDEVSDEVSKGINFYHVRGWKLDICCKWQEQTITTTTTTNLACVSIFL